MKGVPLLSRMVYERVRADLGVESPRLEAACVEAAWPSSQGHWCCNPEVPGSSHPPCHNLDLFLGRHEFKSSFTL